MTDLIRIGTRGSPLALAQANSIREELMKAHPGFRFDLEVIKTTGDRQLDDAFSAIGAKGVFTKELDDALIGGRIAMAVHSLKDLPSQLAEGISLIAVPAPEDPSDAWVSRDGKGFEELPAGSVVGTSSLRRQALVRHLRPDLTIEPLRGNVDTRLRKLSEGRYAAVVLAAAGLRRLGLADRITETLDPRRFLPAIGQGMLALVSRTGDLRIEAILRSLDAPETHRLADTQRRFMAGMEGGCRVPLGCHGWIDSGRFHLLGFVSSADGTKFIRRELEGKVSDAFLLADSLAEILLSAGGREILDRLRSEELK